MRAQQHEQSNPARSPARPAATTLATKIALLAGGAAAAAVSFAIVLGYDGSLPSPISALNGPTHSGEADEVAHYLVRSTLMALDDANRTGNYSVLRSISSPSFQAANSAEQLADAFARQRADNLDLSVAALSKPRWTAAPVVGDDRLLRLVGRYPGGADSVNFALAFEAVGGAWRLYEIHVRSDPPHTVASNR